tara:strand:+ start:414 stop:626 length:213 start_codon:yes stop_codon:yes gene_type:complete
MTLTIPAQLEADKIRTERNALLVKYDWTINSPDLTDDKKAEWKTYRQALRALPEQTGFPWSVTWPTKPAS